MSGGCLGLKDNLAIPIGELRCDRLLTPREHHLLMNSPWIEAITASGITDNLRMSIVTRIGNAIAYVMDQTPELCLAAVKQNSRAIKFVMDQTEEICFAAIRNDPYSLAWICEQTLPMCELAYAIRPGNAVLQMSRHQSHNMCMDALMRHHTAMDWISDPTDDMRAMHKILTGN